MRLLSLLLSLSLPVNAWACAVCFSGSGGTITSYYLATAVMMFIPLIAVGGFVYWLYRKSQAEAPEEYERSTEEEASL